MAGKRALLTALFAVLIFGASLAQNPPTIKWMAGGHANGVEAIAQSPDGLWLATAGFCDRTIKIWSTLTGRLERTLARFNLGCVRTLAFSPDGSLLAAGEAWGQTHIWEPRVGNYVRTLAAPVNGVKAVAFSPDGSRLATAHDDRRVRLWDVETGAPIAQILVHSANLTALAFRPNGQTIATGGLDGTFPNNYGTIRVWNATTGAMVQEIGPFEGPVRSLAYSLDGLRLCSGGSSADPVIREWSTLTGTQIGSFHGHTDEITSIAYAPDGGRMVSTSSDGTVRVWLTIPHAPAFSVIAHRGRATQALYSPDGLRLYTSGDDRAVFEWDANTGVQIRDYAEYHNPISAIAVSPSGDIAAVAAGDDLLRIISVCTGQTQAVLGPFQSRIRAIAISPDGSLIATGGDPIDGIADIHIWRSSNGQLVQTLYGHYATVRGLAFSPDGTMLASAGGDASYESTQGYRFTDCMLRLWIVDTGELYTEYQGHTSPIRSVAFSRNGTMIATASGYVAEGTLYDCGARIWTLDSFDPTRRFLLSEAQANSVDFSPDGLRVIIGQGDESPDRYPIGCQATVWNIQTGEQEAALPHTGGVNVVKFSDDGSTLATGVFEFDGSSYFGSLNFWDFNLRTLTNRIDLETGGFQGVTAMSFAKDEIQMVYGRGDGAVVCAVNPRGYWQGDVDQDGCIDDYDLARVLMRFGDFGPSLTEDTNRDFRVDDVDLATVLMNFGLGCCPQ
ncbi:MAG: hypothetical protein HUU60_00560 [Armatimonadetes bacterium]|nr:hypothetical protein [Armatimonadota bacterium]